MLETQVLVDNVRDILAELIGLCDENVRMRTGRAKIFKCTYF